MLLLRVARVVAVGSLLAAALALVAPVLLAVARTWRGRWVALGWLVPWAALLPADVAFPVVVTAGTVGLLLLLGFALPGPAPKPPGRATSLPLFDPFDRWNPAPWLPESDLVRLGLAAVTRADPFVTPADARAVRRTVGRLLRDLDRDPDWDVLPDGLVVAGYAALAGRHRLMHRFVYVPEPRAPGERFGLLVLLHGHGPNVRVWPFAWKAFADDRRLIVAAPSFGYGAWEHPDGAAVVGRCLDAMEFLPVDRGRVYLAGLSQGGAGVGRAGAATPGRFAGLVFLSPTMEPDVLGSPEFAAGWRGRPVLVVHGGRDRNVRPGPVTAAVDLMRRNGADVTYHLDPDADHFLFFSKLEAVQAVVAGWMRGREGV